MGSRARNMWRRNRRRFVHYGADQSWYDEEGLYAVCDTRIGNGMRMSEDTEEVTCPKCIKWLAEKVEQLLVADPGEGDDGPGSFTNVAHPRFP